MKKITLIFLLVFTVFLSSCSANMEPQEYELNFSDYSYLTFDWDTMTFSGLEEHDILYGLSDPYEDFVILNNMYKDLELTDEQEVAYQRTFDLFDMLDTSSGFSYYSLDEYSTQDIKDYSDQVEVVVTATDLITFNAIKTETYMLKSTATSSTYYKVGKVNYVEQRLDRDLTQEEVIALQVLQENMNYLYEHGNVFDFRTMTYATLLMEIQNIANNDPPLDVQTQLEMAFLIIKQLHEDE